jgi:hypothetical protein
MAFELKIENNVIDITFQGRITFQDFEDIANESEKVEAQYSVSPDRILDFSLSDGLDLPSSALEVYADRRRKAPLKNHIKSAVVAPSPLFYGLSRMFQALNDNPQITVQIFTDKNRALEWLSSK